MSTAIFIPTFNRAHKLKEVVENIKANTLESHTIYFICEKEDTNSINEAKQLGQQVIINEGKPCYADCINTAYHQTKEPYFFTGADDLGFAPRWLAEALSHMNTQTCVIGTNDMGTIPIGQERDATHYLVARRYIEEQSGVINKPNTVLYPYSHNYTDKEFIETAKARGVYEYCPKSIVEHLHWAWGKGRMDATYQKGFISNAEDKRMFESRKHLWNE